MKKILSIFLLATIMLTTNVSGQDRRTLQTKVADILAQMPTNDLEHRDKVMQELIDLGQSGFSELEKLVRVPGAGNDAAVRVAINSATRYATTFGNDKQKLFIEKALLTALKNSTNDQIKAFYLQQLYLVATDRSVEQLSSYLANEHLCNLSTQCLLVINTDGAIAAIDRALPNATGKNQIRLVKAVAESGSAVNEELILAQLKRADQSLKKVCYLALANIGSPRAYSALWSGAKSSNFTFEATLAADAFVVYANRLIENGHLKLALKAIKSYHKGAVKAEQLSEAASIMGVYAEGFGTTAVPMLLDEANNNNKAYREAILHHAENMGGVAETRQWVEVAGEAEDDVKCDIVAMLGRRGCSIATSFVEQQLNSNSEHVRAAAINSLAQLEGKKAIDTLLAHLKSGKDTEVVKHTLFRLEDRDHLAPLAEALNHTSGKAKATLISVIANKKGSAYFDQILELTNDKNKSVRAAAYAALKNVASKEKLSNLINTLLTAKEDVAVKNTQQAVIAAARMGEKRDAVTALLNAAKNSDRKERIIAVLPHIGGRRALAATEKMFASGQYSKVAFEALTNWNDHTASAVLYNICKQGNQAYAEKAFAGFMRQIKRSSLPADQKLLQYRKIMPYAKDVKAKREVIDAIGGVKSITALMYVANYLDDKSVQQQASRTAMKIALPSSGSKVGLYGDNVRTVLEKSAAIMSGAESDYLKINIQKYLKQMPKDKGFVSMFNGKDLSGWKGLVQNPIARDKMSKAKLAKAQIEANKKMTHNWSVKDGAIVFNGKGANLCSEKDYADFEMVVDWRISPRGDSGIYLRGTPQIQIWDTTRVEVGAQVGSGGLYNNKKHQSKPLKVADNPINEWNTFHITMIGDKVTVYLNGELVVDNVTMENYWNRKLPIFEKGAIELQAHGTNLAFRDIYVREINEKEFSLTPEEKADGFVSLFNGKNLNGWIGNKVDYIVEDGEIVVRPKKGSHGNLYTEKEYSDFIYRFEFQLTPGANNGLGIHAPLEGDAAYLGKELQILDNTAPIYANLKPYQYHGSVYGVIAAKRGFLKPIGEWNSEEVIVKGTHIKIILNGTVIVDGDYAEASKNGTLDHRDHPGLKRKIGHIGFLGHGSEVKFRNIRLKDLRK